MFSVVAPELVQLNELIPPSVMLVGLAVNELIVGRVGCVTVTTSVVVTEPVVFVAVRVYVVVAVGLRITDPLADVDAKVPGVMATPVAPEVVQLSVVVEPLMIDAGLAEKELMVGAATCLTIGTFFTQPASPAQTDRSIRAQTKPLRWLMPDCNVLREWGECMYRLSLDDPVADPVSCQLPQAFSRQRLRIIRGSAALGENVVLQKSTNALCAGRSRP